MVPNGLMALLTGGAAGYQQGSMLKRQTAAQQAAAAQAYALKQAQMQQQGAYQQGMLRNGADANAERVAADQNAYNLGQQTLAQKIQAAKDAAYQAAHPVAKPAPLPSLTDIGVMRGKMLGDLGTAPPGEQIGMAQADNDLLAKAGAPLLTVPAITGNRQKNYGYGIDQLASARQTAAANPAAPVSFGGKTYPNAAAFNNAFPAASVPVYSGLYAPPVTLQAKLAQAAAETAAARANASVVVPKYKETVRNDKANNAIGAANAATGQGGLQERARHDTATEGIAQQNADTASKGLGLKAYEYEHPKASADPVAKPMTYKQATDQKQANLKRISDISYLLTQAKDPKVKANLQNEMNSRVQQNLEIDRMLPAGQGLAPMPVGTVMSGTGQPIRAIVPPAKLGPLPALGGYRPPRFAPNPYQAKSASAGKPARTDYSKVPTKDLVRRLLQKVK